MEQIFDFSILWLFMAVFISKIEQKLKKLQIFPEEWP